MRIRPGTPVLGPVLHPPRWPAAPRARGRARPGRIGRRLAAVAAAARRARALDDPRSNAGRACSERRIAAIVLGVAAGGALASGTTWIGNVGGCGVPGTGDTPRFEDRGNVDEPIGATFELDCGSIDLSMAPGPSGVSRPTIRANHRRSSCLTAAIGLRSPEWIRAAGPGTGRSRFPLRLTNSIERADQCRQQQRSDWPAPS